jgi:hypothetical protein
MSDKTWAVYITRTWRGPEFRKQSIDLTYQEAREHLRLLRKIERSCPMGTRYAMHKLPPEPMSQ